MALYGLYGLRALNFSTVSQSLSQSVTNIVTKVGIELLGQLKKHTKYTNTAYDEVPKRIWANCLFDNMVVRALSVLVFTT